MKLRYVKFDGPFTDSKDFGDERPVYTVTVYHGDPGAIMEIEDVQTYDSFSAAQEIAREQAEKHRCELIHEAMRD